MSEIAKDTGMYCFGVKDTLRALEQGAVSELVVHENLDYVRFELRDPSNDEKFFIHLHLHERKNPKHWKNQKTGVTYDVLGEQEMLDWLTKAKSDYGAKLSFVTDRSQEGSQFCRGFGGFGGFLRYKVDFAILDDYLENDGDDDGDGDGGGDDDESSDWF